MIIAAIYLLYMVGKIVWGPLVEPAHHHHGSHDANDHGNALPADLNAREIGTLLPLAALCIFLGVYPKPAMDALQPPIDNTIEIIRRAAAAAPAPQAEEAAR